MKTFRCIGPYEAGILNAWLEYETDKRARGRRYYAKLARQRASR